MSNDVVNSGVNMTNCDVIAPNEMYYAELMSKFLNTAHSLGYTISHVHPDNMVVLSHVFAVADITNLSQQYYISNKLGNYCLNEMMEIFQTQAIKLNIPFINVHPNDTSLLPIFKSHEQLNDDIIIQLIREELRILCGLDILMNGFYSTCIKLKLKMYSWEVNDVTVESLVDIFKVCKITEKHSQELVSKELTFNLAPTT